jgi:hypothetical protein
MGQVIFCSAEWAAHDLSVHIHPASLSVFSLHEHAANIEVEGWPHLLMLVDSSLPGGPAAVGLSSGDFNRFVQFARSCDGGLYTPACARFSASGEEYVIDWSCARLISFVPPLNLELSAKKIAAAAAMYRRWLVDLGGEISPSSVLLGFKGENDYFRSQIEAYFPGFVEALLSGDSKSLADCTTNLAGLGRGATPTGDDLMYGALVAWRFYTSLQGRAGDNPALPQSLTLKTTLLGRHMLEMGRLGLAATPVRDYLVSVFNGEPNLSTLREICRMGASTGYDIAVGSLSLLDSLTNML